MSHFHFLLRVNTLVCFQAGWRFVPCNCHYFFIGKPVSCEGCYCSYSEWMVSIVLLFQATFLANFGYKTVQWVVTCWGWSIPSALSWVCRKIGELGYLPQIFTFRTEAVQIGEKWLHWTHLAIRYFWHESGNYILVGFFVIFSLFINNFHNVTEVSVWISFQCKCFFGHLLYTFTTTTSKVKSYIPLDLILKGSHI